LTIVTLETLSIKFQRILDRSVLGKASIFLRLALERENKLNSLEILDLSSSKLGTKGVKVFTELLRQGYFPNLRRLR
jgi:hypothetical protein